MTISKKTKLGTEGGRKKVFWFLTSSLIVFLGLYIYLVSDTTYSIILRQRTEKSITSAESNLGKLEAEYLNLKNDVTKDLALAKGFKEITTETEFVSRNGAVASLSLNGKF